MKATDLIRTACLTLCLALGTSAVAEEAAVEAPQIDVNNADADALAEQLDGVGVVKAQAIVKYRERNGSFSSVEELDRVKGIGAATLSRNAPRLRFQAKDE